MRRLSDERQAGLKPVGSAHGRSRRLASQLTGLGLVLVLGVLTGYALWVAWTTHIATTELRTIILASDAVQSARDIAGDEQLIATNYRLAPSPEVLAEHTAAALAFNLALAGAQGAEAPHSGSVETQILNAHARYVDTVGQMFAAVAAGDTAAAELIRTEQVDPLHDWFNRQVDALASQRRTLAHERLNAFESLQGWVTTATLAVFALGLSLLFGLWSILRALGRRATLDQAELVRITADTAVDRELARTKAELVAMVTHELASRRRTSWRMPSYSQRTHTLSRNGKRCWPRWCAKANA